MNPVEIKEAADRKHALDATLQGEYLSSLRSRVRDPERIATAWGATFLVLENKAKMAAVVQTAMNLLNCGHGTLNLIGEDSLVLVGVDAHVKELTTYPTEESYCQYVVDGHPLMVTDSVVNPLVCQLKSTIDDNIRCYLGVPVTFQEYIVGGLCVYDYTPREWTTADVRVLTGLALTVEQILT